MCTDFILPSDKDNQTIISGRTMDFSESPESPYITDLVRVPAGITFTGGAPGGKGGIEIGKGHRWENQYGFIGVWMRPGTMAEDTGPTKMIFSDGLNTEGLSAAALWLSYSDYEQPGSPSQCLSIEFIVSYVLGTCATIDDVQEKLDKLTVWFPGKLEYLLPSHLSVHDSSGKSLVLEFVKGHKVYYNNTIGALANGPTFDVHATNFYYSYNSLTRADNNSDKYIQLTEDKGRYNITTPGNNGYQFEVLSSGMSGLPGDSSSPSRFTRTAKLRQCVPTTYDNQNGVQYALQVLGRVAVCEQEVLTYYGPNGKPADPRNTYNPTLWMVVRSHRDKILYYCTHLNHNLHAIQLYALDFSRGTSVCQIPMASNQWFIDSTSGLQ
ncbi:MAG: linear amide C-N hydrolase [Candidatus Scalindua sp.]|nr:linear amide C-N hydrolase [Candidatus Scalindua sp.]